MRRLWALALVLLGCRAKPVEHTLGDRAYAVLAPKQRAGPALVVLHAFDTSPTTQAGYFDAQSYVDRGWVVVLPSGLIDKDGKRFWNATDACCDQHGTRPDDVAYLDAVLDDAAQRYAFDPAKVFLAGVSNGGFMAQRYACDRAARVRGFASVSGGLWTELQKCAPTRPVAALLVHGTADAIVKYDGGGSLMDGDGSYPPAPVAADFWKANAKGAAPVELWTIPGGGHSLPRSEGVARRVAAFFDRAQ